MIMLSLKAKHLAKIRVFNHLSKSQLVAIFNCITRSSSSLSSSATSWLHSRAATSLRASDGRINGSSKDAIASSIKERFRRRNDGVLCEVFKVLGATTDDEDLDEVSSRRATDLALSNLGLRLDEAFVVEVLRYGSRKDVHVLSCLRFFEWAARQPGFCHTRATFNAIFRVLSRATLMALMLEFHGGYAWQSGGACGVRFHRVLVMGYAVAGKPEFALQLLGKMRFQGMDLDSFGYHVLLNALVEKGCFDSVKVIAKQIEMRGFENEITWAAMVKSLCKQQMLDEAEEYLRVLVSQGKAMRGDVLRVLVDALCKSDKFDQAGTLIEEFKRFGTIPTMQAYDVWIKGLVQAGRLDGALEFLKKQKSCNGYVPDMFRINMLICRLLCENRLEEACELLMEMKESKISPDEVTMNAALCLFCKAGMVSVALDLCNSRSEFGLSPNSLSYTYLINTLCGDGTIDQAYCVLQDSIDQGYFPSKKAFSILADTLCSEGKLDKMKQLLLFALERNVMPSSKDYNKIISALCRANRVEDGYLIYGEVNKIDQVTAKSTFHDLIIGFSSSNRGAIAARLLVEMQESGHEPSRALFFAVIRCLCKMKNPEKQFLKLLEAQLARQVSNRHQICNLFIDVAGHAKKPDLSREAYETLLRSGTEPTLHSDILLLQSYFKSERFSDAVKFFNSLRHKREFGRKLCHIMLAGLCKANRVDIAVAFFKEMKANGLLPTIQCYELLIKLMCSNGRYDTVVNLVKEYERTGRLVTSFIGNTLLLHASQSHELCNAWIHLSKNNPDDKSKSSMLGQLIGVFCGHVKLSDDMDSLEEETEKCFPLDLFTYNMLLRRLCSVDMDRACQLFYRMREKGYKPNQCTYDTLVLGFLKHGKREEANRWLEEMLSRGFHPSEITTVNFVGFGHNN